MIIEPSGAADPRSILVALPYYKGKPIESQTTIAVLDPLRLEMLFTVMEPLIVSQMTNADYAIISKCDLATSDQIEYAHRLLQEYNPEASVIDFSPEISLESLLKVITPWIT